MGRERNITWFVYTNDSYTNKVISEESSEKTARGDMLCSDGVSRPLWECEGSFITKIRKCKKDLHLVFVVYKKRGKYGKIEKATFLKKGVKKVVDKVMLLFV